MRSLQYIFSLVAIVFCLGCSEEESNFVEPEFQPYVDMFFEEAKKRNVDLTPDNVSFSINYGSEGSNGICYFHGNRIEINKAHWIGINELTKQRLIFHEMGHCVLERLHNNEVLPNGECKSFLKGTEENNGCGTNLDNYNIWRTFYIDELFDENISIPEWYISELDVSPNEVIFDIKDSIATRININASKIDPSDDILFEATFEDWSNANSISLIVDNIEIVCTPSLFIIFKRDDNTVRYSNSNVSFGSNTKISFIRRDGFYYYQVDDSMLHIEDQLDTYFDLFCLEIGRGPSGFPSKAPMSLTVSLLE